MSYVYSDDFFDSIERGAVRSARIIVRTLMPLLQISSVLDVGCGRGAWLRAWAEEGVAMILGIDGSYIDPNKLLIPRESFVARSVSEPFDLGLRFELVQSLEVAEHLPSSAATNFIKALATHGDVILFSAAVVGQGGENHLNEQPLEYWRQYFRALSYDAFDAVRPLVVNKTSVEEWYRFNTIIYANSNGERRLPPEILAPPAHRRATQIIFSDWREVASLIGNLAVQTRPSFAPLTGPSLAGEAWRRALLRKEQSHFPLPDPMFDAFDSANSGFVSEWAHQIELRLRLS